MAIRSVGDFSVLSNSLRNILFPLKSDRCSRPLGRLNQPVMIPHGLRFMSAFVVFSLAQEFFGQSFLSEVSEVVHASIARCLAGISPGGLHRSVFYLLGSGPLIEVARVYKEVLAYDCLLPLELHKPRPQICEILVHLKLNADFGLVASKADHSVGQIVPAIDGLVIELTLAFL